MAKSRLAKLMTSRILIAAMCLCTGKTQRLETSETLSRITSNPSTGFQELPTTVTVQAVDTNGDDQTSGGDNFVLVVENLCDIASLVDVTCTVDASNSDIVAELPMQIPMTDVGDGTYEADYTIVDSAVTVTTGVLLQLTSPGIQAEYFDTTNWTGPSTSSDPDETQINFNWGSGEVGESQNTDNASAIFSGQLSVQSTDTYTFTIESDDGSSFTINGQNVAIIDGGGFFTQTLTTFLTAGTQYDYELKYREYGGAAKCRLKWETDSFSKTLVPASAFALVENKQVGGLQDVVIAPPPSVPTQSEVTPGGPLTIIAGNSQIFTMQSKDQFGTVTDDSSDAYVVELTRPDGSLYFTSPVDYVASGQFVTTVFLTPTVTGTYTMTITMTNSYTATDSAIATNLKNTNPPFTVTVVPGPIWPLQCFTGIPATGVLAMTAGVDLTFKIYFADQYSNLYDDPALFSSISDGVVNGKVVAVAAIFDNDDQWESPIQVPDIWVTIQGDSIDGDALNINSDGTLAGVLSIQQAGEYELSVTVDGIDVINSPHSVNVQPAGLYAPNCVISGLPSEIHAGFDYEFLIQGRDYFNNNIQELLDDTLQNSAVISLIENAIIFEVQATVSDHPDFPGVYQVYFAVPLSQKTGIYASTITLEGPQGGPLQVPAQSVDVMPCSNWFAVERGLIEVAGETRLFEEFPYSIDGANETIHLEKVADFCSFTPLQTLVSAALIVPSSATEVQLDQEGLLGYGISLELTGSSPSIQVSTKDPSFADYAFELTLKATLSEETDWADTQVVPITYSYVGISQDSYSDDAPKFDKDSVSDKTLTLEVDEVTEEQSFSSLTLDCHMSPWTRNLPEILDEVGTNKFEVTVNLGKAASFLEYSPNDREFKLKQSSELASEDEQISASISITLRNNEGRMSTHSFFAFFSCMSDSGSTEGQNEQTGVYDRKDKDPLVPYIDSISQAGEVRVRFDRKIQPKFALTFKEYNPPPTGRRRLVEQEFAQTVGRPNQEAKNFTLIHRGTAWLNQTSYPSIKIAIQPEDSESLCANQLGFSWETIDLTPDQWTMQLNFENPSCVSGSGQLGDELLITIYNQQLFMGTEGKLVWPETTMNMRLKRQIDPSDVEAVELAIVVAQVVVTTGLGGFIVNLFLNGALSQLVNALKNLQIIVHFLLIQMYMVAHTEMFILKLQRMISFEVIDLGDYFADFFSLSDSDSVDIHFEAIGYQSSDAIINLGPIFAVILLAPLYVALVLALSRCACCNSWRNFFKRKLSQFFFNSIITFVDGCYLILAICCAINIYQVKKGAAEVNFSYYFALSFYIGSALFVIFIAAYLLKHFEKIRMSEIKERVGAAYEDLDTRNGGRWTITYFALSFWRRLALSLIVTFGIDSRETQRIFMNHSTLVMLGFIALVRPFKGSWNNRIGIINEFTILLLYSHCITQTDFVESQKGRMIAGWSIILLILMNIGVNFGNITFRSLCTACTRARYCCIRRQRMAIALKLIEKRRAVKMERERVLQDEKHERSHQAWLKSKQPVANRREDDVLQVEDVSLDQYRNIPINQTRTQKTQTTPGESKKDQQKSSRFVPSKFKTINKADDRRIEVVGTVTKVVSKKIGVKAKKTLVKKSKVITPPKLIIPKSTQTRTTKESGTIYPMLHPRDCIREDLRGWYDKQH